MRGTLQYRRQFILSRQPVEELGNWQRKSIGPFCLQAHPDLEVSTATNGDRNIVLAGYLYDTIKTQLKNHEILNNILSSSVDYASFIQALKPYPGQYIVIYLDNSSFCLLQDALALREVFYATQENLVICGSQPNLLERFSAPKITKSVDPELNDFVANYLPKVRNGRLWPGDGTPFETIKHLLPNHCLDLNKMVVRRYWPNTTLTRIGIDEAVHKSARFLQGAMKAASERQKLMVAVTAGYDSRSLLAASKEICSSIHFFINKIDQLNEKSNDIKIPREIFKRIGIPFSIHEYTKDVPDEFKKIYFENVFFAKEELLPVIYNIYYSKHADKMNVLGVGEVGRTKYFNEPKKLTPYYLSYMLKYKKSRYAVRECESWLAQTKPIAREYGLNIMTLFWWEVLIGNWGSVGNSESDIAIEEFDPYSSHYIYETFLQTDPKYRTYHKNILFKELVNYMWPELLSVPVNPPETFRGWVKNLLSYFGVELTIRRIKSVLFEMYYHLLWENKKL